MDVVHTHCAGLDVHKKTVVAAIIVPERSQGWHRETRTFGTTTGELLALSDWLMAHGVTHVAMESTGEYWKPVFNLLEHTFEALLVNASHVKAVPGRKTDINDAQWIAELLKHGLLKASFVPPEGQRELRELTQARSTFVRERATLVNRVQKVASERQHQARQRRQRCAGGVRPCHAGRPHRRTSQPRGDGSIGARSDARET